MAKLEEEARVVRGRRAGKARIPLGEGRPASTARAARNKATPAEFDRLIHEQARLGILAALAVSEPLSFRELKMILKTTDGNLSVHARKLEGADYVSCKKFFEGRMPKTEFRLTPSGRRALERYLDQMEVLIRSARHH